MIIQSKLFTCSVCLVEGNPNLFIRARDRHKYISDGNICKECHKNKRLEKVTLNRQIRKSRNTEKMRIWRNSNPERDKDSILKRTYGISLDDYNKMLKSQGFGCAICGSITNKIGGNRKYMLVDHDHTTRKVRGILCNLCNTKLAVLDNHEFLRKALIYLKKETLLD